MKRDPVKDKMDAVAALRGQPRTPEGLDLLRRALADRSGFVVAAAADALIETDPPEVLALLAPALSRLLDAADPVRADKGCKAKIALAGALYRNDAHEEELFRRGLRHVQPEPVWGGSVDTAAELRGTCALALAALGRPGVVSELAELLADPEGAARAAAGRAIGCAGRTEGVPLLRYKALVGDDDPQVIIECVGALLALDREDALPLARRLLEQRPDERAEAVALALGQSRLEAAWPLLREWGEARPGRRKVALVALATLRQPAATEYLIGLVREAPESVAAQAMEALGLYRHDEALQRRAREAYQQRSGSKS